MPTTVRCLRTTAAAAALAIGLGVCQAPAANPAAEADPFARFDLPDAWEARFWSRPEARALLTLSPRAVADLVPTQAGIRHCRCPACDATEDDDPLIWSVEAPRSLTCRRCGVKIVNDHYVAKGESEKEERKTKGNEKETKKDVKEDKPVSSPEETVEVLPGLIHHYPYYEVEPERQRYPDERLYFAAKRAERAREFLTKAALYAAVRHHEQPAARKDPALARMAAILLLRFAQVYPAYATHYDQPESAKYFDKANLLPPYRRGYKTAKWDWTGSQDVPLNLVVAYALLRKDPALAEAGRLLNERDPAGVIERDLFRASATFTRSQPDEFNEASLQVDRGLLAVGRLLNDPSLVNEAMTRLERFTERGFYHDGFWAQGTLSAHRRVLGQLDGWIDRLLTGYADPPMLALAHLAGSAVLTDRPAPDVLQASWPAPSLLNPPRVPIFLGGAGLARLAVGRGSDALDVELRGLDSPGPDRIERQAIRLAVGGRTTLGDLDEGPGLASGFDRASVSRNTVVIDGLNQRESPGQASEPAPGGNFLFFATDPDFQVVTLDDRRSYPFSATRYRQTLIASAGPKARYALGVFEVWGGRQHDQVFHAASGSLARWRLSVPTTPGPATLLSAGLTVVPRTRAESLRWFVQAFGEFHPLSQGAITRPAQAWLAGQGPDATPSGVRLHVLSVAPLSAVTATSPDVSDHPPRGTNDDPVRGSLVLRRRSEDGASLRTTFVTLYEPVSTAIPPLTRVARVPSAEGTVAVYVESADGPQHLVVNLSPGTAVKTILADGRVLETDGLAVRVTGSGLVLAGGTFAESGGRSVRLKPFAGQVVWSARKVTARSHGWFESDTPLPDPETLVGRVLLIRHGDGTTRGWTLSRVENTEAGARLHVREEPGFLIDATTGVARYYQYPRTTSPGPHVFRVSRIAR